MSDPRCVAHELAGKHFTPGRLVFAGYSLCGRCTHAIQLRVEDGETVREILAGVRAHKELP